MTEQPVHVWGNGERAVLVHGAVSAGEETWQAQQPLAAEFELVVPDRVGYDVAGGEAPDSPDVDAEHVAALLGDGAHLVGYSVGGLVAMLAAARAPGAVRSLVLVEPVAFDLVRGRDDVEAFVAGYEHLHAAAADAEEFLREFLVFFGNPREEVEQIPSPLPRPLHLAATAQFTGPAPWEVPTPVDALAAATFPVVVVSGAHSTVFDAICDELASRVGAERAVVPGAGHAAQFTGEPFNDLLRDVWAGRGAISH